MMTSPAAPFAKPTMTPNESDSCHKFCERPMPKNPAAMRRTPVRMTRRAPRSSASLPKKTPPTAQPSIPNIYGTVAVVRDQPNTASMGRRNRLNEFMPMDVIVTTQAQSSRTMLWESGMSKAERSSQLCQIGAEITTECRKKFVVAGGGLEKRPGKKGKKK